MDAKRLRINSDFAPVARNHCPLLSDAKRLPCRFLGIADQRVVKLPRTQGSIRFVATVGKGFRSDCESRAFKDLQHKRPGKTHKYNVAAPAPDTVGNRLGKFTIPNRLVSNRPGRLAVPYPPSPPLP